MLPATSILPCYEPEIKQTRIFLSAEPHGVNAARWIVLLSWRRIDWIIELGLQVLCKE